MQAITNYFNQKLLKRLSFIAVLLFLLTGGVLLTSCGGSKEVKKVSPESKLAQEAFELAETLKEAYLRNDRDAIGENSTKEGYREIIGALKPFDSAELTFTPTWVEIMDSTVNLTISWKGIWVAQGKTTEERGSGVFVLEGKPLKLVKIQRANPFSQPE
jgi:hypothetical protein